MSEHSINLILECSTLQSNDIPITYVYSRQLLISLSIINKSSICESSVFHSSSIALYKMCSGHPNLISHFLCAVKIKILQVDLLNCLWLPSSSGIFHISFPIATVHYHPVSLLLSHFTATTFWFWCRNTLL